MINKLRNYFLSGLIVFLPVSLTVYFFYLAIGFAEGFLTEGILGKLLRPYIREEFSALYGIISIIVCIALIVLFGFLISNYLGRTLYSYFERFVVKVPIVKQVYLLLKEIALFVFGQDRIRSFRQVVLVEYPRKGIYSVAFLTNEALPLMKEKTKKEMCNVFVPSSPSPITGFTIIIPKEDIIFTDISVEKAFKFFVSGGVVNAS